jgi:hypothetical protein
MSVEPGDLLCRIKGYSQRATEACECGVHTCCSTHIRHISVMCRDERLQPGVDPSVRLPTSSETYTEPVLRRLSLSI